MEALQKLKGPAISLIVVGSLNGILGILSLLSGLARLAGMGGNRSLPRDEAERMGYMMGTVGGYILALISLLLAPVVIYGAIQMLKGKKPGLAKAAAIVAMIPISSCCFLLGIPAGIWALVVMAKPEVKALFQNGGQPVAQYQQESPRGW